MAPLQGSGRVDGSQRLYVKQGGRKFLHRVVRRCPADVTRQLCGSSTGMRPVIIRVSTPADDLEVPWLGRLDLSAHRAGTARGGRREEAYDVVGSTEGGPVRTLVSPGSGLRMRERSKQERRPTARRQVMAEVPRPYGPEEDDRHGR